MLTELYIEALLVDELIGVLPVTSPGECVMRPAFGCGIRRLLFSKADVQIAGNRVN